MTDSPILPGAHSQPLRPDGLWKQEWFAFLRNLAKNVNLTADQSAAIAALADRVAELESESDLLAQLSGPESVVVTGSLVAGAVNFALDGDEATPEASHYYGTDSAGEKGWHDADAFVMSRLSLRF